MYISKVSFDTYPRFLSKGSVDREHGFIMSLFPSTPEGDPRNQMGVLFRKEDEKYRTTFLVQSNTVPSLENIKSDATRRVANLETKEVSSIYRQVLETGTFSYKIRVNTVKSVYGKREPVRGIENIQQWWEKKAVHHGFIADTERTAVAIEQSQKLNGFSVSSSTITGIAEVQDINKVLDSVEQGIGKSKSYGFGMLLVGRA